MKAKYYVPALTALNRDGTLDHPGNQRLYRWLMEGETSGIVLLGSMGECFGLSLEQKRELIRLAVSYVAKGTRLFVGTGSTCLEETVSLSRYALSLGADGVMVVPPYYFPLNQEQAGDYLDRLLSQVEGPVYLYNFPAVTGYDLSPELVLRLVREHSNLAGYKDTVTQMDHTARLIELVKPDYPEFEILCGYDNNFAHHILSGGDGCIGGMGNLAPKECGRWMKALVAEDWEAVARYQRMMDRVVQLGTVGSPLAPLVKGAARLRGLDIGPWCTPPFSPPSPRQLEQVRGILQRAGLAE